MEGHRADPTPQRREPWPSQSQLFETLPSGIVYHNDRAEIIAANPAAQRILGLTLHELLGLKPMDSRWRVIDDNGSPLSAEARPTMVTLQSGRPVHDTVLGISHPTALETRWINVNTVPVFDEQQILCGVYAVFEDITDRRQLAHQRLLDQSQRNEAQLAGERGRTQVQTFLKQLATRLNLLSDADAIQLAAASALGEFIAANRVGYAEDCQDGETILVARNYCNGLPDMKGRYRYDDYGPELLQAFRAGRAVVRPDIANDASLTAAEKASHAALGLGATVNVPLLHEGHLVAVMFAHSQGARRWTQQDVELIEEVAAMTWSAVLRGRTEGDLRDTQRRLQEALGAAQMAFWEYDELTGRLRGSSTLPNLLGLPDGEELQFNRMLSLIPADQRQQIEGWMAQATSQACTRECRTTIVRPRDGRTAFLQQRLSFQRETPTACAKVTGLAWDVSDSTEADLRFRSLFEQAPLGMALVRLPEGTFLDCNHALADILKRPRADIVGQTWQHFTHPDDLIEDLKAVPPLVQGTLRTYSTEKRYRRRDGSYVWVRLVVSTAHMPITGQSQPCFITTVEDITQRRQMQEQERLIRDQARRLENEHRMRLATSAAHFGFFEVELPSGKTYWSPELREIMGIAHAGGLPPWASDLPFVREILNTPAALSVPSERQFAGPYCFDHVLHVVHNDRDTQWLRVYGQTSETEEEAAPMTQRLYGVAVDITAEQRVLEQLRVSQMSLKIKAEELQLAVEAAGLGTWVWDLRADQLAGSDIGLQHYGLLPGCTLREKEFFALVHPDDRPAVRQEFLKGIRTPRHCEAEFRVTWPDGSEHWIHAAGQSRFNREGVAEYFWGVTRDITEYRQTQQERSRRDEQEQMLKRQVVMQTLQVIAHELHQPLQAVISLNDMTQKALESTRAYTPELGEMLRLSADQSVRAAQVLRELMHELRSWGNDHSRLKSERLDSMLAHVVERAKVDHPGTVFKIRVHRPLPPVRCYDLQTEKVLFNLISNAAEAMAVSGTALPRIDIDVATVQTPDGPQAQVSVRDYGPGISPQNAQRVFDPFFTTKPHGMGLGLAISRSLIQAQGGDLTVLPDCAPGAQFIFTLPFADE